MKKAISIILAVIIVALAAVPSFAAQNSTAKLYNVYGDGMLFQQKKEAVLAGTGTAGGKIECILKDSARKTVTEASAAVGSDGIFKVSFIAPEGGYEEYTIELKCDGEVFDTLTNVVFGELWLSGGQSNMQLEMRYSVTGKEMLQNGTRGSKNVRYFYSAPNPVYNGDANNLPYYPQTEIPGCCWFDGTDERIFNISGIGFFFAEKLQKDLDMPVGLLSGSLGGSSIKAWIPREYIEADKTLKKAIGSGYVSKEEWKEDGSLSVLGDCTGMYNKKIAPLENFRPSGMIWCQGEADSSWEHGRYTTVFNALQKSYSDLFGYENELIPVVVTALCDFSFGDMGAFKRLSSEFSEMQQMSPETRSLVSLSDIPLTYSLETQVCHPIEKKPSGERMAYAAQGLVYGKDNCACAPVIKSSEIKDGSIYITYNYCGDTLKAKGDRIHGFTLCGKDGVYLPAEAEIVSADTVRVYCNSIENPKAAMYANGLITERCNLYAYKNGEYIWPVLPTITDWSYTDRILTDFGWTDCDVSDIWREESLVIGGRYDIWESEGASAEISSDSAYMGAGGLKIVSEQKNFSVSPITVYTDENGEEQYFQEFNENWMNHKTMSVMVRNDGSEDINLSAVKIYKDNGKWVAPLVKGALETGTVIPADGKWHKITFCLDALLFSGKILPADATRTYLSDVRDVEFCFEGEGAQLSFDEISFETSGLATPVIKLLGFGPVSLLFNIVTTIIGLIKMLSK